jgi:hypothetical protein
MPYRHTQSGTTILATCAAIGIVGAVIAWRISGQPMTLIATAIVLAGICVVFNSLTVEVEGDELRWHFGPGFRTYRLGLDEIRSVSVVRNQWWNGFGIRKAPSANFPKFVLRLGNTFHELRKVMGTSKFIILVPLSI